MDCFVIIKDDLINSCQKYIETNRDIDQAVYQLLKRPIKYEGIMGYKEYPIKL